MAIGAPRREGSGAVVVFRRLPGGGWTPDATLTADDDAGRLGAAVAITPDGEIVAGAPATANGRGAAFVYRRNGAGGWTPTRLDPPRGATVGLQFGSAIAANGDELWIGAPGADGARGRIDRFAREGGGWAHDGSIADPGLPERTGFGRSLALGDGVAVAGAPAANGNLGLAAIFTAGGDGLAGVRKPSINNSTTPTVMVESAMLNVGYSNLS